MNLSSLELADGDALDMPITNHPNTTKVASNEYNPVYEDPI